MHSYNICQPSYNSAVVHWLHVVVHMQCTENRVLVNIMGAWATVVRDILLPE